MKLIHVLPLDLLPGDSLQSGDWHTVLGAPETRPDGSISVGLESDSGFNYVGSFRATERVWVRRPAEPWADAMAQVRRDEDEWTGKIARRVW